MDFPTGWILLGLLAAACIAAAEYKGVDDD